MPKWSLRIIPSAEKYYDAKKWNDLKVVRYSNPASGANEYVLYPDMKGKNAEDKKEILTEIGNEKGNRYPLVRGIVCDNGQQDITKGFNGYLANAYFNGFVQKYDKFSKNIAYVGKYPIGCGATCTKKLNNGMAIWANMEERFRGGYKDIVTKELK